MKNTYKGRKRRLFYRLDRMSGRSLLFLNICLPLILAELIVLVIMLGGSSPEASPDNFPAIMEYIFAGLALTVGGALVIDAAEKKDKND